MATAEREITVAVHCGVHGRVAADLARIARQSGTRVAIRVGDTDIECSSILEILSLGLSRGYRIRIRVDGRAQEQILDQVCALLTGEAT
jgi:phosphotransferase system HPr (HPr) family protein